MTHDESANTSGSNAQTRTRDELLARLDDYGFGVPPLNALRAIVELHKPRMSGHSQIIGEVCDECSLNDFTFYPCPTIQAIEKELR